MSDIAGKHRAAEAARQAISAKMGTMAFNYFCFAIRPIGDIGRMAEILSTIALPRRRGIDVT
jgi:hypothetical protein